MIFSQSLTRFYLHYLFSRPWWLVWFFVGIVFARIVQYSIYPLFSKYVIDWILNPPTDNLFMYALPYLVGMAILMIIVHGAWMMRYIYQRKMEEWARFQISEDLVDYVHSQTIGFYAKTEPGKISRNVDYILSGFYEYMLHGALSFPITIVVVIVSTVMLIQASWILSLVFLAANIIATAWTVYSLRYYSKTARDYADLDSEISGRVNDSLSNFITVKLFAGAARERVALRPMRRRLFKFGMRNEWADIRFWVPASYVYDFFLVVSFGVSVWLAMSGRITPGDVVFAVTAYKSVTDLVWEALLLMPFVVKAYSAASSSYHELVRPIALNDTPNAIDLKVPNGRIQIKNLSFKFRREWVLRDFNLDIKPGERVGIVGLSGAGKTTLARLIMRFYDPQSGAIMIDDTDIRDVTQDSLRRNISFVPQDETMFNRTLAQNIGYGRPGATMRDIERAAKQSNSYDFIMATDKKFQTIVGTRGIKLSGGQRQRVSIARAFLKDAPILIMDEATSALDSESESVVQKSILDLTRGRTCMIIAHRLSTLKHMDRIIVIDNGRVAESGSHSTLIRKRGGIYAKLWKMQSDGFI